MFMLSRGLHQADSRESRPGTSVSDGCEMLPICLSPYLPVSLALAFACSVNADGSSGFCCNLQEFLLCFRVYPRMGFCYVTRPLAVSDPRLGMLERALNFTLPSSIVIRIALVLLHSTAPFSTHRHTYKQHSTGQLY